MTRTITSRNFANEPLARLTLTEKQLEAILLLMDKVLEQTSSPENNADLDADELLGQMAVTYQTMTGIRMEMECYPTVRSFPAQPEEFEIIPANEPVWDNQTANELVNNIQENIWLFNSILDVAIDRASDPQTKVQWTKAIIIEGVAQFKNDTPRHLDLLNQTIVHYSVLSLGEYDRLCSLFNESEESEGKPHPLLSRVEV